MAGGVATTRVPLYPFQINWSGGPGLTLPVLHFGTWVGWLRADPGPEGAERVIRLALLQTDLPYSVMPFSVRQVGGVRCDPLPPEAWTGPVPLWRGVPCELGTAHATFVTEGDAPTVELPLLVLLPERDPPGPRPAVVYLGMEFLLHFGIRAVLDYASVRFTLTRPSGPRQVDATRSAGYLDVT